MIEKLRVIQDGGNSEVVSSETPRHRINLIFLNPALTCMMKSSEILQKSGRSCWDMLPPSERSKTSRQSISLSPSAPRQVGRAGGLRYPMQTRLVPATVIFVLCGRGAPQPSAHNNRQPRLWPEFRPRQLHQRHHRSITSIRARTTCGSLSYDDRRHEVHEKAPGDESWKKVRRRTIRLLGRNRPSTGRVPGRLVAKPSRKSRIPAH
jgi:hypothetical protein